MRARGLALAAALFAGPAAAEDAVVALGGSVTEIVYALGEGDRLVARDSTSTHPPEAEALPDVGYVRALSPEGVLSIGPTLILAEEGAGPPEAVALLEEAGVPFHTIPDALDGAGIVAKIRAVGEALGDGAGAERLAGEVERELAEAQAAAAEMAGAEAPRVLFILSTQGGRITASGAGTAADAIIRMAGGRNAAEGFEGYKLMTDEAVAAAAPDAILMMDRGGDHGAADDELRAMPALAATPAALGGAVVRMDGLRLLGFGPRTAGAVRDLAQALHGG